MTLELKAIEAWKKIVGDQHVITNENILTQENMVTFAAPQKILAFLRPKTKDEIQRCVEVANKYSIPVYPVSSGLNIGYGSKLPVKSESVVMELFRMNKILNFSEKFGYVTVEPGVTFLDLIEYLRQQKSEFMLSVGGQPAHGSVIGNILEKGFAKGLQPDLYNSICAFGIVLPTGEFLKTDFNAYEGAKSAFLSNTAPGPSLNGLFLQSNFGIITQVTLWLHKKPEFFGVYKFSLATDNKLGSLIEEIRSLKMENALQGNLMISNAYKDLPDFQQYPWEEMKGKVPLTKSVLMKVGKKYGIEYKWTGTLPIYGINSEHVQLLYQHLNYKLSSHVAKQVFMDNSGQMFEGNHRLSVKGSGRLKNQIKQQLQKSPYLGYLPEDSIKRILWRRRENQFSAQKEGRYEGCGVIFLNVVVPLDGSSVMEVIKIIEEIFPKHTLEPMIGINIMTERSACIIAEILYDRNEEGGDERAQACYKLTLEILTENGYYPYRLPIFAMQDVIDRKQGVQKLISTIKSAIDPHDILSSGRYG